MSIRKKRWLRVLVVSAVVLAALYVLSLRVFDPRVELDREAVKSAAAEAAGYLVRHLDENGRFDYIVRLDSSTREGSYNVLRHAGSIYALAQYHELTGDARARESILRAADYLVRRHIRPVANLEAVRAVFSFPGEEVSGTRPQIKLGGCALGLIALVKARELNPERAPLELLRQLGGFILYMQEANGHFRSKCDEHGAFLTGFESGYYPGETILALALLHQIDPDPRWLEGALEGIAYLSRTREGLPIHRLPNDHWLMIATQAVLPQYAAARHPPIPRERIRDDALAIGQMMLGEQRRTALLPGMRGSFAVTGAVAPNSTRLEGLLALQQVLGHEHPNRVEIEGAIEDGLRFILRGQVHDGKGRGGFTESLRRWPAITKGAWRRQNEIRIDYVQHSLSALTGYLKISHPP